MLTFVDENGVISNVKSVGGSLALVHDPDQAKRDRYLLQNVAASFLRPFENPKGNVWRVTKCARTPISSDVVVLKAPDAEYSYYGNLFTCGSVWTCPVCASKITERRKDQLNSILDLHADAGGFMLMVTLTFRHSKFDNLSKMLGKGDQKSGFRRALQTFRNSRSYKSLLRSIGYVGLIRALEVTYSSNNGWHPHTHELFLLDGSVDAKTVIDLFSSKSIFRAWLSACRKAGLGLPNERYGINVVFAVNPSDYLQKFGYDQKWSVSSELTKQHLKSGRISSVTPFDFLRLSDTDFIRYRTLFSEYASAFYGASQLFFSRGLLNIFGVSSISDEELALDDFDNSRIVIRISKADWSKILRLPFDLRFDILRNADLGDYDYYRNFI